MAVADLVAASVPVPNLLELPNDVQQKWLDDAANMGDERVKAYELYDQFYDGEHRAKMRDRAKRYLEDATGVPFTENFTQPAVDTLAERLQLIGFSSSAAVEAKDAETGESVVTDAPAATCEEWWQHCRMDAIQGRVHRGALKRGDEFVIVDWDQKTGYPTFSRQLPHQCKVVYSDDAPDTVEYAVKVWNTSGISILSNPSGARVTRLNVYWPGQIDKWFRPHNGAEWQRWFDDPEDGEEPTWPVWWTDSVAVDGEPFGVAMKHFRNMPRDDGMGISRVKQAIPFQLELDKVVLDLNDLIDNHADPQDWVSGTSGNTTDLTRVGGVWELPGDNVSVGRLDASPTDNLLNAVEGVLSRMARRLRMPLHLLTGGTPPSGEALKTAESGIVQTAKDCQVELASSWEDLLMLGLKLAAAFGDGVAVPESLEVQWENPETRSDGEDLAVAEAKLRIGFSKHTVIAELGGDPEKEQERRNAEDQAKAEIQATLFDAGGLPV